MCDCHSPITHRQSQQAREGCEEKVLLHDCEVLIMTASRLVLCIGVPPDFDHLFANRREAGDII